VNHCVRHRLPNCHVYTEGDIVTDPQPTHEFSNCSGGFGNSPNTAGEFEFIGL
jgi:hypothetical protein